MAALCLACAVPYTSRPSLLPPPTPLYTQTDLISGFQNYFCTPSQDICCVDQSLFGQSDLGIVSGPRQCNQNPLCSSNFDCIVQADNCYDQFAASLDYTGNYTCSSECTFTPWLGQGTAFSFVPLPSNGTIGLCTNDTVWNKCGSALDSTHCTFKDASGK